MAMPEITAASPWWHAQCEDSWNGPFATRDDAVAAARRDYEGYSFLLCQAEQDIISLGCFDGDDILERLAEYNEEKLNEDGDVFSETITPAMERDLADMFAQAVLAWTVKHNLSLTAWAFACQGPHERIAAEQTPTATAHPTAMER